MSKTKKILVVIGILVCLSTAIIVPVSAFSVPINNEQGFYLYTPVSLHIDTWVSTESATQEWSYTLSQNEWTDTDREYGFYLSSTDGASQTVTMSNNYQQISNGGYKGYYQVEFTQRGYSSDMTNILTGFSLPSVWSCRTLKSGTSATTIVVQGNDGTGIARATYSCQVFNVKTGEKIDYNYTMSINLSETTNPTIPVIPSDLETTLDKTGWRNFVLLDYQCQTEGLWLRTDNEQGGIKNAFLVVIPTNGSCGRDTPFASEYALSFIEKMVDFRTTVVDANLDFTDWLSTAFGFLDVELFGNFTLGGLLATAIGISLFLAFLKIFAGG